MDGHDSQGIPEESRNHWIRYRSYGIIGIEQSISDSDVRPTQKKAASVITTVAAYLDEVFMMRRGGAMTALIGLDIGARIVLG